ncbi:hypothetical protein [Mesorhizobium sp. B2-3-4]|uniref:hypothetical protein n=1 Tax=Mesorhizobium sp. B2-3-4 TaxID=2589959 RepID=UPI001FF0616E|nr:hypothetical protein [Mesorhizobium sp. B2-3-4]
MEVVSPYIEADLFDIQYVQSADQMWIMHKDYPLKVLTRTAHMAWTLDEYPFEDGPYDDINDTSTTLTPADYGSLTPKMTGLTTPSGTVDSTGSNSNAWKLFDKDGGSEVSFAVQDGFISYRLAGGVQAIVDAYFVTSSGKYAGSDAPSSWKLEGSNDGAAWSTIDSQQGENGWAGTETRYFEFFNKTPYEYHRFRWLGNNGGDNTRIAEIGLNRAAASQTPFNLTASSTAGINDGAGFQTSDVGRNVRLLGSDGHWRWAEIKARTSATVVTIVIHGLPLPDLSPISRWRLGTLINGKYLESGSLYEERLAFSRKFSVYASATGDFNNFAVGEKDDDAMAFLQAGGGQANDITWIADSDGALLIGTSGGVRALSGSGIDEALTPSSFKNRRSRTAGCSRIRPIDAGQSFLYVTRSRRTIAELSQVNTGRFSSDDIGQISEHIPKKGVVELAFQTDPDPLLWFPLDNGELGGYTHQPSQDVRGMHRHDIAGAYSGSAWGIVESACVTPGQTGNDDLWLIVKRTISGVTKRYIEVLQAPFEYDAIDDAFAVDCGLTYSGATVGTVSGLSHLNGQTVDVLADGKVFKGLTVGSGQVTLPGGATAAKWQVGLPFNSEADTLELDVGGKDGSIVGRRKKVARVIMSLLETDTTGLSVQSFMRGRWENVRLPSIVAPDGKATLFTGNVEVPIDDTWEGQGRVRIRHTNPTPCTIRAFTPAFDAEP